MNDVDPDPDPVQFAADAILDYLQRYPDSADTAEGIHEWWITWPVLPESILVTYAALEQIEKSGRLERRRLSNREIWRLAAS